MSNIEHEMTSVAEGIVAMQVKHTAASVATYPVELNSNTVACCLDGHTLCLNEKVLLTAQLNPCENGLYVMQASGLMRVLGLDSPGDAVRIVKGQSHARSLWFIHRLDKVSSGQGDISYWRKRLDQKAAFFLAKVDTALLPHASNQQVGMMKFASINELNVGSDNVAVTPQALKKLEYAASDYINNQINQIKEYTQKELALLQNAAYLQNFNSLKFEKPKVQQVYLSPNQHGGFFGTVMRQYLDSRFEDDTLIACHPGGNLIDSKLLIKHSDYQSCLDDVSYNDTYRARFRLFDNGELKLQLTEGYQLRGGWVDYALGNAKVISVNASSNTTTWVADNVLSAEEHTYWMSETNSGNEEWVVLEYDQAFVATSVNIVLNNGRQGSSPTLQGSHDGSDWIELASINSFDFPNDERNFRHVDLSFSNDQAFKYYRYHSESTVYVLLEYIKIQ